MAYGLLVLEASAGSGKTYRLTQEYLNYLAADPENGYRKVWAVTFTNKATEEMKSRIVKELSARASSPTGYAPFKSQEDAKKCLAVLLHDYTRFHVSTIDEFFQQILRMFVYDLDIKHAYDVELSDEVVLSNAIDACVHSLDANQDLYDWVKEMVNQRLTDGESFDFTNDLKELGKLLFDESFADSLPDMNLNPTEREQIKEDLLKRKKEIESGFQAIKEPLVEEIDNAGLIENVTPSGSVGALKNLDMGGDVKPNLQALENDDVSKWVTKAKKENKLVAQRFEPYVASWSAQVSKLFDYKDKHLNEYNTIVLILQNFRAMALLYDLNEFCNQYQRDTHALLLSSCTQMLSKLVAGCDTPFIYERIGTTIDHYMLDEFQDTSNVQWRNFEPLIGNTATSGHSNLVVGDVKQSIYRWRGSDWELLPSLKTYKKWNVSSESLTHNWRSCPQIIQFNNELFNLENGLPVVAQADLEGAVGKLELTPISELYKGVCQNYPEQKSEASYFGKVKVQIFKKDVKDWKQKALEQMFAEMTDLKKMGYQWSDMAVLTRKNPEAVEITSFLLEKGVPVLSNQSLILQNTFVIRFILLVLEHLATPVGQRKQTAKPKFVSVYPEYENRVADIEKTVDGKPLYEVVEQLVVMFDLAKDASNVPYLQAFQDLINDYLGSGSNDYAAFLQWWNLNG
ncbi:MAG: UvrD-helicase domain-containing protein, partial [Paludibacteraceae bacterium]|nr:UvrD-helicase domain-containing protein [Paludibacteraceae bacterium]